MVLLAILRLRDGAFELAIIRELDGKVGRRVSRGALYKILDRLGAKGHLSWSTEETTPERGGHPRRLFSVTPEGVEVLRTSREALFRLWDGLDPILGRPRVTGERGREPPRLAEWLLRQVLPPGVVGDSILGDAREEHAEYVRRGGRSRQIRI